jgi:hypothetical protein
LNNFQYKERTYAKEILEKGFISNHIKYELQLLVKYYKELGHKPKERKELLYKFCEKHLEGFDRVIHFKLINSVLNHVISKKNIIIEIENVNVTDEELKYIDNLDIEHDYKKVVFTLFVLDKLNKEYHKLRNEPSNEEHYFGGSKKYKELISSSKITLKKNNIIHNMIGELDGIGIVQITSNSSIKLSFIYEISESDNVVLKVSTYDNIGYYYDLHAGENKIKQCERCETPIKIIGKNTKYCDSCRSIIEKEKGRERVRKHRNNIM